jgi:large subunit ribosomal protein L28
VHTRYFQRQVRIGRQYSGTRTDAAGKQLKTAVSGYRATEGEVLTAGTPPTGQGNPLTGGPGPSMGFLSADSSGPGETVTTMSRICPVTGKRPQSGNNVSHANNKTKRKWLPNLHSKRFWVESEKRFVRMKVSAQGMRLIDKVGIEEVMRQMRARGERA